MYSIISSAWTQAAFVCHVPFTQVPRFEFPASQIGPKPERIILNKWIVSDYILKSFIIYAGVCVFALWMCSFMIH